MRLNWKNDDDAITTLNRMGVAWSLRTVAVSEIDVKTSRHNHARKKAIIDSNVDDYADAMDRGDVFPKIVLARVDGAKEWLVAGGNHRLAAAIKLGLDEVDVIVVECDKSMFSLICPALNLYVGQREDRVVRIAQAADAAERLGISAKQAAEEYRVPKSSVCHAINERKVIVAARRIGVRVDGMPASVLRAIAPVESDAVLLPLAVELAKTKLNSEEVRVAVSEAKKQPTEADRVAMLRDKIETAKQVTISGRIYKLPTRMSIRRCVTTLEKLITAESSLSQMQITKEEAREFVRTVESILKHLRNAE